MAKRYYEKDGNLALLKDKTVAIIGYGSQGHAHALESARQRRERCRRPVPRQARAWPRPTAAGLKVLSGRRGGQDRRRDHDSGAGSHPGRPVRKRHRAAHAAWQDAHVRARLQHPFRPDSSSRRRGRLDDRAQSAGSSRARAVHRRRRRAGLSRRPSGRLRPRARKCAGLRVGARLPEGRRDRNHASRKKPRAICSASRPCCAAA